MPEGIRSLMAQSAHDAMARRLSISWFSAGLPNLSIAIVLLGISTTMYVAMEGGPTLAISGGLCIATGIWTLVCLWLMSKRATITRFGDRITVRITQFLRPTVSVEPSDFRMEIRDMSRGGRKPWSFAVVVPVAGVDLSITPAYGNYKRANDEKRRIIRELGTPDADEEV
jgi:hypothetical protein